MKREERQIGRFRVCVCVPPRDFRLPWRDVRGLGLVRGVLLPLSNRDVLEERVLALGEPLVVHVHGHLSVSVVGVSDEGCDARARVRESRRAHRKVFRSRVRPSRVLSCFVLLLARRAASSSQRCRSLGGRKKVRTGVIFGRAVFLGGQRVEVRFAVARGLESEGKKRKNLSVQSLLRTLVR